MDRRLRMLILRRGVDSNRALLLGSVMQEGGVVSEAAHAAWLRQQNRIPVQTQCRCNVVLNLCIPNQSIRTGIRLASAQPISAATRITGRTFLANNQSVAKGLAV